MIEQRNPAVDPERAGNCGEEINVRPYCTVKNRLAVCVVPPEVPVTPIV